MAADQPLSIRDLLSVAEDIKATLEMAFTDLRGNIQSMAMRMDDIERTTLHNETAIHQLQASSQLHNVQLRDLHRYMEDLDNHGRHHNIRVRGLRERIDHNQLAQATYSKIF